MLNVMIGTGNGGGPTLFLSFAAAVVASCATAARPSPDVPGTSSFRVADLSLTLAFSKGDAFLRRSDTTNPCVAALLASV
jgi:hypothetical protein